MDDVKRILVAIDLSDCALMVVRRSARLAHKLDAELVLLHVLVAPLGLSPDTLVYPPGTDPEGLTIGDYVKSEAMAALPKYVEAAREEGAQAVLKTTTGRAADAILGACESFGADMIVVGSHGRTGINRVLLGSVSESVVRRASVPVLTIRSLHRPECEAKSCQTCRSGTTKATLQSEAELAG